jgi:hypothetical protein
MGEISREEIAWRQEARGGKGRRGGSGDTVETGDEQHGSCAAGEERLGRCAAEQSKFYRLYLRSGKVTLAVMYLRRVLGAAAQNLGVDLRRPSRGQTCGGMLGAMARIAPARSAKRPTKKILWLVQIRLSWSRGGGWQSRSTQSVRTQKFAFSLGAMSAESPLGGNSCSKLRPPHRGTPLGPFACQVKSS